MDFKDLTLLKNGEAAVAADLVDAHEDAIAFTFGIFVELRFDRAFQNVLAHFTFLVDRRLAVKSPADAARTVVVEHADVRIFSRLVVLWPRERSQNARCSSS